MKNIKPVFNIYFDIDHDAVGTEDDQGSCQILDSEELLVPWFKGTWYKKANNKRHLFKFFLMSFNSLQMGKVFF